VKFDFNGMKFNLGKPMPMGSRLGWWDHIPHWKRLVKSGLPEIERYLRPEAEAMRLFGNPIGIGRHRIVFLCEDHVVKIPHWEEGEAANFSEIRQQGNPNLAKSWIHQELTQRFGVCISCMEWVSQELPNTLPPWVNSIDCCQVGLTVDGRLVAYDFG